MNSVVGNPPEYNESRKVQVLVSMTISKSVTIEVDDYDYEKGIDEDGNYYEHIDYSNCDFTEAVKKQIYLPTDSYQDWEVDELEVVIDE